MTARILAVRSALPDNRCLQAEFTDAFATRGRMSAPERVLLDRLHASAEVETRHTALPLEDCGVLRGAEAVNDRYIDEATALGERALRRALDAAGLRPADLDLLIVTSVTGVAVPSLDARLIPRLGLRPRHQAAADLRARLRRRRGRARTAARLPARLAGPDRGAARGRAVLAELADLGDHPGRHGGLAGCSATEPWRSSPAAGRPTRPARRRRPGPRVIAIPQRGLPRQRRRARLAAEQPTASVSC